MGEKHMKWSRSFWSRSLPDLQERALPIIDRLIAGCDTKKTDRRLTAFFLAELYSSMSWSIEHAAIGTLVLVLIGVLWAGLGFRASLLNLWSILAVVSGTLLAIRYELRFSSLLLDQSHPDTDKEEGVDNDLGTMA